MKFDALESEGGHIVICFLGMAMGLGIVHTGMTEEGKFIMTSSFAILARSMVGKQGEKPREIESGSRVITVPGGPPLVEKPPELVKP